MKKLIKGNSFFLGRIQQTEQPERMEMIEMPFVKEGVHSFPNSTRKGKYSSIGYNTLMGPVTQAERGNMPFMDPEFEYDSPEF